MKESRPGWASDAEMNVFIKTSRISLSLKISKRDKLRLLVNLGQVLKGPQRQRAEVQGAWEGAVILNPRRSSPS